MKKAKIDFNKEELKKYCDKKIIRKFNDMKDGFKNSKDIKGNPILYVVYIKSLGNFEIGLTVINPGTINSEFYMTKGHKHKKSTNEIYTLLDGKGKLMLQKRKNKIIELKKGDFDIIPKKTAHRLINTGKKKLEVLTIYPKNAGHDYNFKFAKRVFK
jgi:glucose-6-phosphate isomerase